MDFILLAMLVYNYRQLVSPVANLVTTTPPKRLDGFSWNFEGIFLRHQDQEYISTNRDYIKTEGKWAEIKEKKLLRRLIL